MDVDLAEIDANFKEMNETTSKITESSKVLNTLREGLSEDLHAQVHIFVLSWK